MPWGGGHFYLRIEQITIVVDGLGFGRGSKYRPVHLTVCPVLIFHFLPAIHTCNCWSGTLGVTNICNQQGQCYSNKYSGFCPGANVQGNNRN